MAEPGKTLGSIRFGRFDLSVETAELRKDGVRLKLSGQAVDILLLLAANPGKLVTREDLQHKLWPGASFGDPEHGLNAAVNRLRETLGDSATEPTYIETIPGRGYRFIAALESPFGIPQLVPPQPELGARDAGEAESNSARRTIRWVVVAGATALAVGMTVGGWWVLSRKSHALTDKDTIVLADFKNTTGDAVFDDTLKQGLSVQLGQSPFLDLLSERKVNETLKLMGRSAGDRLTPDVAREVCQRTGSKAMLTGSIASLGSQYVIGLKAVNCDTGAVLAEAQEQAPGKEAVLKTLDAAAVGLRGKLGESLNSVQTYATPLAEATTPSLEALQAYSLGQKTRFAKGGTAALPFYKRAVELDPNFAIAYAVMSVVYGNLNETGRAAEYARRAYGLREKVSDRERFYIEAHYYDEATGELEKAAQVYELWKQIYPRDHVPYSSLVLSCED